MRTAEFQFMQLVATVYDKVLFLQGATLHVLAHQTLKR